MDEKQLNELLKKPGAVDIRIVFDTTTGDYYFNVEESGLPTSIPSHILAGILSTVAIHSTLDGGN